MGDKRSAHLLTRYEITKALWALLDQAAVSLANFGLHFSLARYTSPEAYGQFVVVFTLLLFVYGSVQAPFTLDPLIILGGKMDHKESHLIYSRRVVGIHLVISIVGIIALLVSAQFLGAFEYSVYARAALLASIPLLFMNLRFLIRSFYIMGGEFTKAFRIDFSVLIAVVLGAVGLIYLREASDWVAVALMTIAETTAILFFIATKYKQLSRVISGLYSDIRSQPTFWEWEESQQNWEYGKWLFLANSANYAYQNAQFLLLPAFVPLSSLAGYRACYTLAQPVYLFATGLEAFVWNRSAESMKMGGLEALKSVLWKITLLVSILIVAYALIVGLSGRLLLETVYAGKFGEFANLIWFFTVAALLAFLGKMLGTGLRVLEATRALFSSTVYAGIVGVVASLLLIRYVGITGAAIGYVLSAFLSVTLMAVYWNREAQLNDVKMEMTEEL